MSSQAKTLADESEDYKRGHRDGENAGYIRGRINGDEYERIDNRCKQLLITLIEDDDTQRFDQTIEVNDPTLEITQEHEEME